MLLDVAQVAPDLRAYFYDGKVPPRRGTQRDRVLSAAEMLGDVLEGGLVVTRLVPPLTALDGSFGWAG